MPLDVGFWLLSKLASTQKSEANLGMLGSRSFQSIDLIVNLKANRAGRFISILGFIKNGAKGRTTICCLLNENQNSTSRFYENLKIVLMDDERYPKPCDRDGMLKTGGVEVKNLKVVEGFKNRPVFLRNHAGIVYMGG